MSRRAKMSESPEDDLYGASPPPSRAIPHRGSVNQQSMSPSPASSISSDKENRSSRKPADKNRGSIPMMGPPKRPQNNERSKRKRPLEKDVPGERDRSRRRTIEPVDDTTEADYDPDQDINERREIRKGLRDLSKTLADNRSEFLAPHSTGLRDTLLRANELSSKVKQTSDATIDSRLLVTAADYSYKKTVALLSGDTAQGVDLDEFLGKCKAFMRRGDDEENAPSATQRRRREDADEVGEDDNDGEPYNWGYLGRMACLQHNSRPSLPGFLYGPLSVEKRVRKVVVRKAGLKIKDLTETRPEVLKAGEIQKDEANLSTLCTQILNRLMKCAEDRRNAVEARFNEDMEDEEGQALLDKYRVSAEGGIALYPFVINPDSFGQTIENMFYTSFLIRDGKLGVSVDDRGLPYLNVVDDQNTGDSEEDGQKHQAILEMDHATWKDLIDVFEIKRPMILHREEEDHSAEGANGWYS